MRRAFTALCIALVATVAAARANTEHDYPFFPEALRPAMEWVDREAKRDDPFLRLTFRSNDAPASTNRTAVRDALIGYGGPHGSVGRPPAGGPLDGAIYGFRVGSDKWRVVYDPANHLAYYGESCCAFGRDVLMRVLTAAPHGVPRRDLSNMRTARGVRIGMTAAQVRAHEGAAPRRIGAARNGRTALAYWSSLDGKTCVEERTFVFAHDRLQAIHVVEGC
jgi:hypothetical protein